MKREFDISSHQDKSSDAYISARLQIQEHFESLWKRYTDDINVWGEKGVLIGQWYCPQQRDQCIKLAIELESGSESFLPYILTCETLFTDSLPVGMDATDNDLQCFRMDRIEMKTNSCNYPSEFESQMASGKMLMYAKLSNVLPKYIFYQNSISLKQIRGEYLTRDDPSYFNCSSFQTSSDLHEIVISGNSTAFETVPVRLDTGDNSILHPCGVRAAHIFTDTFYRVRACSDQPLKSEQSSLQGTPEDHWCTDSQCGDSFCQIYNPENDRCECFPVLDEIDVDHDIIDGDPEKLASHFKNPTGEPHEHHSIEWLPKSLFPKQIEDPGFINWTVSGRIRDQIIIKAQLTSYDTTPVVHYELMIHNRYNAAMYNGIKEIIFADERYLQNTVESLYIGILIISVALLLIHLAKWMTIICVKYIGSRRAWHDEMRVLVEDMYDKMKRMNEAQTTIRQYQPTSDQQMYQICDDLAKICGDRYRIPDMKKGHSPMTKEMLAAHNLEVTLQIIAQKRDEQAQENIAMVCPHCRECWDEDSCVYTSHQDVRGHQNKHGS
eukprot:GHVH01003240.1.p1 GENE.GHVH01003240.1~~GHVH01003240.1.p1  ORF type:complete len:551 (-),score=72.50 GHVH01003240.1:447-2099(-)